MEHFQTYYIAKAFDKQISPAECKEHERILTKEIVNNIRHKGSSINILVQFYPKPAFLQALRRVLDFYEDSDAGRFVTFKDQDDEQEACRRDVLKNIPKDFSVDFIVFSLSTLNPEKVNAKVMQSRGG
jgi:hypothetical protein